jgi:predicted ester cyclase
MDKLTKTAEQFFKACDTGQGWDNCSGFCTQEATFSAQAEPLAAIKTLREYAEWMKGLLTLMPDARYEVKSFATDARRQNVCAYGVFTGSHTREGGPLPPTGKSTNSDYVYVMQFDSEKICHVTRIWSASWSMRELGWT